mgnify:CR=1 FL=1
MRIQQDLDLLDILDSQMVHPLTLLIISLTLITRYLLYNKSIPTKWAKCSFNKVDVGQSTIESVYKTFSI